MRGVDERHVLASRPLLEERGRRIFVTKQRRDCLLKGPTKQHGRSDVLLLPAIEIPVTVSAWAGQKLRDLRVAVGHRDFPSLLAILIADAACGGTRLAAESCSH